MKKVILIIFIVILSLNITSCTTFQFDAEAIISPPKLTAEQHEIYIALTSYVTLPFQLRYPKNGNYRSAFVVESLNGKQGKQAMVFYELKGVSPDGNNELRINILDKINNEWKSVADIEAGGTDIDKILFIDTINDGSEENFTGVTNNYNENPDNKRFVVIGFYAHNVTGIDDRLFKIYSYEQQKLNEVYEDTYNILEKSSFYGQGENELLYLFSSDNIPDEIGEIEKTTTAVLMKFDGDNFSVADTVIMNEKVSTYYNVTNGFIEDKKPAVYLDGMVGKNYITEILTIKDGKLYNVIYNENINLTSETERNRVQYSMDVDSDGIIGIPECVVFPGYDENDSDALFYTYWKEYKNEQIVKRFWSYVNTKESYIFRFPDEWEDEITAVYNTEEDEISFHELNEDDVIGYKLLSIKKIKTNEINELSSEYFQLDTIGANCFVAKIEKDVTNLTPDIIKEMFAIYYE